MGLDKAKAHIPIRIYIPAGEGPFPLVSYFHGGGFVLMSVDSVDKICRTICSKSGSVVMSVNYRLAPEDPYPAGPEDCITAVQVDTAPPPDFATEEKLLLKP